MFDDSAGRGAAALDSIRKRTAQGFDAITLAEALKNIPQRCPLVENLLERATLGALFGDENTRKTFIALDLALSVATGKDFHGLRVTKSKVLYVAGEGRAGLLRRAKGWLDYHKLKSPDIFFVNVNSPDLLDDDSAGQVRDFMLRTLVKGEQFGLVIADTLGRCASSDEGPKDMPRVIGNMDMIREETGAAILLLHHTPLSARDGKGKIRLRGHTSLSGSIDSGLAVEFDEDSQIATLTTVKQKDAEPLGPLHFSFLHKDLGETDSFGNALTTLVPVLSDDKPKKSKKGLGRAQRLIVHILEKESPLLKVEALARAREQGISRSGFYAALITLCDHGFVRYDGDLCELL